MRSIFVVFRNETDGTDSDDEDTPCDKHRKKFNFSYIILALLIFKLSLMN